MNNVPLYRYEVESLNGNHWYQSPLIHLILLKQNAGNAVKIKESAALGHNEMRTKWFKSTHVHNYYQYFSYTFLTSTFLIGACGLLPSVSFAAQVLPLLATYTSLPSPIFPFLHLADSIRSRPLSKSLKTHGDIRYSSLNPSRSFILYVYHFNSVSVSALFESPLGCYVSPVYPCPTRVVILRREQQRNVPKIRVNLYEQIFFEFIKSCFENNLGR